MDMNEKFIVAYDRETAVLLSSLGFTKIQDSNNEFVFLNNKTIMFSDDINKSKIKYSNILRF